MRVHTARRIMLALLITFASMRATGHSSGSLLILGILPVIAVAVVGAIAWRVYVDASNRFARGHPVVLRIGALQIDSPLAWALACLVCCVIFVPIYLVLSGSSR